MFYKFRFLRAESADWTLKNPVLDPGEPGFSTDTDEFKIGDGETGWNDLPSFINKDAIAQLISELDPTLPDLAAVATSGSYNDLTDKPSIPVLPALAEVATSGDYDDLSNKPTIPTVPVLAEVATSGDYDDLSNKPTIPTIPSLAAVATSGKYDDLTDKPTIPTVPTLAAVATSGQYSDLTGKPSLATVATSGSYADLSNKPTIPTVPALAAVATSGQYSDLLGKPSLAAIATSGQYSDLTGKPSLAAVATSGSYNDLSNKPDYSSVYDALGAAAAVQTALRGERDALVPTGFLAQSMDPYTVNGTTVGINNGAMRIQAIYLRAGTVISKMAWMAGGTGATSPTHQWFELRDANGNLLWQSTDDTTNAWAALTLKTLPSATTNYTVPTSGLYYGCIVVTASTMPTICGPSTPQTFLNGMLPVKCNASAIAGLTTGPSSSPSKITISASTSAAGWCAVG